MLADAPVAGLPGTFLAYEPIGVVLAIMPWNCPLWQVIRFLAPALAAGNGAILKHAANVPQCALAVEEVIDEHYAGQQEALESDQAALKDTIETFRQEELEPRDTGQIGRAHVCTPVTN